MSVGLSVSQWHFPFVRSFCITAPAQPHGTDVVMYMALPLPSPLPPLWFLHNCPCPITWSWCCQVYGSPLPSTALPLPSPLPPLWFLHYCPCPITWSWCCQVYGTPLPSTTLPLPRWRGGYTTPAQMHASSFWITASAQSRVTIYGTPLPPKWGPLPSLPNCMWADFAPAQSKATDAVVYRALFVLKFHQFVFYLILKWEQIFYFCLMTLTLRRTERERFFLTP